MSIGFGSIARIGQLYPSGGLCDYEMQMMAPEGIQFLTTRMPFKKTGLEDDRNFVKDIEQHAALLADAGVSLIAMNCTAASMVAGPENVNRRILAATQTPSITTIEAVLAAMKTLGFKRIGLMTPYKKEVVDEEIHYLATQGFEVVRAVGKACDTPIEQGNLTPQFWLETAQQLVNENIDGLLISCAGIQVGRVIESIEQSLNVPVVASNQALLWACLQRSGYQQSVPNFGKLLREFL
jgi:maleate isomerase